MIKRTLTAFGRKARDARTAARLAWQDGEQILHEVELRRMLGVSQGAESLIKHRASKARRQALKALVAEALVETDIGDLGLMAVDSRDPEMAEAAERVLRGYVVVPHRTAAQLVAMGGDIHHELAIL